MPGDKLSSEKFETMNHFISVTRKLHDMMVGIPESLKSGTTEEEVMRQDVAIRLEIVQAAQAVRLAPHDPEADTIIGSVLLQRIEASIGQHPIEEWEARAAEAIGASGEDSNVAAKMNLWWETSQPIIDLGFEALQRVEQQQTDIMLEGIRRAAEQTPGFDLRITEVVGDTLVSDETVLGPEPGHEDSDGHRMGRVSSSAGTILGIDDDRMETDIAHLLQSQSELVLLRNNLPPSTIKPHTVRLAVCERVISKISHDLEVVGVSGDLPSPMKNLNKSHFPALRAQLMLQHNMPLSEGSVLSRANRGDSSAWSVLMQLIVLSDMMSSADPYFLPGDQMETPVRNEDLQLLPPERSFLVWHDTALYVGDDVDVLAWLFITDKNGTFHPVVHVIRTTPDGALETSWCSLRTGQGSVIANKIGRLLCGGNWNTARPLRLPNPAGSKAWKTAAVRSSARIKEGGLHGLRSLQT